MLAGEIVDGFLVIFSLVLQLARDCIEGATQCLHPAPHGLDFILVFSQLAAGLCGLLAFSFLDSTLVFLELLIGLFFFFFQRLLHFFDLRLEFRGLIGLFGSFLVFLYDGIGLGEREVLL